MENGVASENDGIGITVNNIESNTLKRDGSLFVTHEGNYEQEILFSKI